MQRWCIVPVFATLVWVFDKRCRVSLIAVRHFWMEFSILFRSFVWILGGMIRVMKASMLETSHLFYTKTKATLSH